MSTNILHISDTHLGKRQYKSERRRKDFAKAFDQAVDIALGTHPDYDNSEVDAVIHTGDLFDDSEPRLADMHDCQKILRRLNENNVPFYAIIGNHERKLYTQFVDLYEETGLATRLNRDPTIVNDEVALYGIDAVRDREWDTTDFSLTDVDDSMYKIVCMHQLISPPIKSDYLAKYELQDIIPRFGVEIDAMALGDYHKRCVATVDGVKAWYPGSTERCDSGEKQTRSVDMLEIDTNNGVQMERRRMELETPDFITIPISFDEDDSFSLVERRVKSYSPYTDEVVIVELEGDDIPVTKQQVYELLKSYGVEVAKVRDNRNLANFEVGEVPDSTSIDDINTAVDDVMNDKEFTDKSEDIEDIVRNTDEIATSNVREEVKDLLNGGDSDED